MVLNDAKMGADFKATVSFHGGLDGVKATKGTVKGKILVCHGGADKFVDPEVKDFRSNMDLAGVRYTFKVYVECHSCFHQSRCYSQWQKV
jgi:dienelactone hydrolase